MARGECSFRQRDVTAALKAARDAGVDVARVEIDAKTHKIVIVMGKPDGAMPDSQQQVEQHVWDEK